MTKYFCDRCKREVPAGGLAKLLLNAANESGNAYELCSECVQYLRGEVRQGVVRCAPGK